MKKQTMDVIADSVKLLIDAMREDETINRYPNMDKELRKGEIESLKDMICGYLSIAMEFLWEEEENGKGNK